MLIVGLSCFSMAAEMLHVGQVAEHFPNSIVWQWLAFHTDHVAWTGCSLHDLSSTFVQLHGGRGLAVLR